MLETIRLSLMMLSKPSQTLWQLRYEGRGKLSSAFFLMALAMIMRLIWVYGTGFIFRSGMYRETEYIRASDEILTYLIFWLTWTLANWGVSTLMDGEGTVRDIAIASSYALTPLIVLTLPMVLLSNVLTLQENSLYLVFSRGSLLWTGYLLFLQVRTTNDFDTKKALSMTALTVIAMFLLWALAILLYLLNVQIIVFVGTLYRELALRMGI